MNASENQTPDSRNSNPNAAAADSNGEINESGNVDRIRNILFGPQMRDYDSRFQRLEERLARDAAELREDLQRRLVSLEAFMKGEVESMTNRVKTERTERLQALEKAGRELADTARSLELKISNLDEQSAKDIRDLRQQLLEQSKALSAEIKEKHDQMKASLENEAQQIRGAMTGREALAEMFTEVALRLKNDFRVPGAS
jgi:Fe2+ transport system protein B